LVSFNGGPNGTAAKPTAAELVVAKETHVAPTPDQVIWQDFGDAHVPCGADRAQRQGFACVSNSA